LDELVRANDGADRFTERLVERADRMDRCIQDTAAVEMGMEQAFDLLFEVRVLPAGLLDKGPSFFRRFDFDRRTEDRVNAWLRAHRTGLPIAAGRAATYQCDGMASTGPPTAADFTIFFPAWHRQFRQGARRGQRPSSASRWCARCASDR